MKSTITWSLLTALTNAEIFRIGLSSCNSGSVFIPAKLMTTSLHTFPSFWRLHRKWSGKISLTRSIWSSLSWPEGTKIKTLWPKAENLTVPTKYQPVASKLNLKPVPVACARVTVISMQPIQEDSNHTRSESSGTTLIAKTFALSARDKSFIAEDQGTASAREKNAHSRPMCLSWRIQSSGTTTTAFWS